MKVLVTFISSFFFFKETHIFYPLGSAVGLSDEENLISGIKCKDYGRDRENNPGITKHPRN